MDYCPRIYNLVYLGYQIRDFLPKSSVVENAFCDHRAKSEVLRLLWICGGFRRMEIRFTKLISSCNYFIKPSDTVLHLGNNAKLTGQNKHARENDA